MNREELVNAYQAGRRDFTGVSLNGENLDCLSLRDIQLQGASMVYTSLIETDLQGANLQGARLTNADLRSARLVNTNLDKADLKYANLRVAVLTLPRLKPVGFLVQRPSLTEQGCPNSASGSISPSVDVSVCPTVRSPSCKMFRAAFTSRSAS